MKKNGIRALVCLCLLITLLLPLPVAMAEMKTLDLSLIPEDTIAIFWSPKEEDQPRIVYVLHGITKDEEFLSVNIRQISTDPQVMIYEEDTANLDEQHIRWVNEFSKDTPIIGSHCEALIENDMYSEDPRDRWYYYQQNSCTKHGYYMDETFLFPLNEIGDMEENITLCLSYRCIPTPAVLDSYDICLLTIDIADYLK